MVTESIVEGLKRRYDKVHPLIFLRSVEKARNDVDLFDILETLPADYPIVWNQEEHCWVHTADLLLAAKFKVKKG
jgi:hypothetical protein